MNGLKFYPGMLDFEKQRQLLAELQRVVKEAPLFTPRMPKSDRPFSVRMTNCGRLGWVSDREGYRYQNFHPVTRRPWPPMPEIVLDIWRSVAEYPHLPEACLVNYYETSAKMGLHQDKDEDDLDAPVVSVSLGDTALFRAGGINRSDPTKSFRLSSGDVISFGGDSRMIFHGVDRVIPNTSQLLSNGGRINLTLRRVTKPESSSLAEP